MYIGNLVKQRMDKLGLTLEHIVKESLIEKDIILKIINNKIQLKDISFFDLESLSSVLKVESEYFHNQDVRNKDILNCISTDNKEINNSMAQMQFIMKDFEFLMEIYKEGEQNDKTYKN